MRRGQQVSRQSFDGVGAWSLLCIDSLAPQPDPVLAEVAQKVVTSVLGGTDAPGINVTSAHVAFEHLDTYTVPTSCATPTLAPSLMPQ